MKNSLAEKFTFLSLLKFTAPTIIMMVFMSLYTMVDGVFVANIIGENALSAVNIAYPIICIVLALGIMLATGGSAIIARKMGEGKSYEAKQNFTLIVIVSIVIGVVLVVLGLAFSNQIIKLLGATDALFDYAHSYLKTLIIFAPLAILQMLFQFFFVTAGKPHIGLLVTILGGIANIILDYLFMVPLNMGVSGAALATGIGYSIPAIFGLIYFCVNKKGTLHFMKPKMDFKMLIDSCGNGSSEMVTNLAGAITTLLFNITMIKYLGENGVASITIVLYAQFLLTAVYLGFSSGVAPVLSYNYGTKNSVELKKVFKMSMIFITTSSLILFILSIILSPAIVTVFVQRGSEVYSIAIKGFLLFSITYLFCGINIFASSMFTAFSNGRISAFISFLRTFVFIVAGIIFLPMIIGANGVWLAVPLAEILTIVISVICFVKLKDTYKYA